MPFLATLKGCGCISCNYMCPWNTVCPWKTHSCPWNASSANIWLRATSRFICVLRFDSSVCVVYFWSFFRHVIATRVRLFVGRVGSVRCQQSESHQRPSGVQVSKNSHGTSALRYHFRSRKLSTNRRKTHPRVTFSTLSFPFQVFEVKRCFGIGLIIMHNLYFSGRKMGLILN